MAVKSRAIAPSSPHPFDLSHPGTPSDIIVFCATIILLNALDFQAYTYPKKSTSSHDVNAIPLPERITCTYARGQAKILAKWALKQYDLQRQDQPNVSAFTTVFLPYLAQLRDTLLLYKERAISFGLRGPAGCTVLRLKAQVDSCFSVVDLPTGDSSHGPRMLETLACGRKVFTFAFKNLEERLFHEMDFHILLAGQSTGNLKYAAFLNITIPSWLEKMETPDQDANVATCQKRRSQEGSPDSPLKQKRKKSEK